jgi:hypothetical protein
MRAKAAALRKLCSNDAACSNNVAFGDLLDLYTFECRACGVSHIETAELFATPAAVMENDSGRIAWH